MFSQCVNCLQLALIEIADKYRTTFYRVQIFENLFASRREACAHNVTYKQRLKCLYVSTPSIHCGCLGNCYAVDVETVLKRQVQIDFLQLDLLKAGLLENATTVSVHVAAAGHILGEWC